MALRNRLLGGLIGLLAGLGAASAHAEIVVFNARLDGTSGPATTGSTATGVAKVQVDTERRTVSVDMALDGIGADALWDTLVAAPIGPIHFHKYATAEGGESVLVLPLPYGANYHSTPKGLHVTMSGYDYAAGAQLLKSTLTFEDFVAAMRSGLVVLNVHTDAFNMGEIAGRVTAG